MNGVWKFFKIYGDKFILKWTMESDLGERVFAAERITKKRLRKGKGKSFVSMIFVHLSYLVIWI